MRENFVQSMAKQVEAKLHEESKFWRASKPLPNQSSMQGRESEKESSIQQFRNPFTKYSQACKLPKRITSLAKLRRRNFASLAKLRMNFATPCEIFASLVKPKLKKINFTTPCEIFASLRKQLRKMNFSSLAKSSCNLQIFLHQLHQIFIPRYFV